MDLTRRKLVSALPATLIIPAIYSTHSLSAYATPLIGPMWLNFVRSLGISTVAGVIGSLIAEKIWPAATHEITEASFTLRTDGRKDLRQQESLRLYLPAEHCVFFALSNKESASCGMTVNIELARKHSPSCIVSLLEDLEMRALSKTADVFRDTLNKHPGDVEVLERLYNQSSGGVSHEERVSRIIQMNLLPIAKRDVQVDEQTGNTIHSFGTHTGAVKIDETKQTVALDIKIPGYRNEVFFGPFPV